MPIQGVQLQKEAVLFGEPLILKLPTSGLLIDLDNLENEATP